MPIEKGSLSGIRILDLSNVVSGPMATQILADQGADVIKVEAPSTGDISRMVGANRNGVSALFTVLNRNKRSICVDLKTEKGLKLLRKLVKESDVLVENFRPGAMDRLKLSYEDTKQINESLIYVSISGFGSDGPYHNRRVYDPVIQAICGYADTQGSEKPELVRNLICDKLTALTTSQAITSGLFARERRENRSGELIELSMLDASLAFLWPDGMWNHTFLGSGTVPMPSLGEIYRINATKNGSIAYLVISDLEWTGLCQSLEIDSLINDSRFRDLPSRIKNIGIITKILTDEFSKWNTAELCERFDENQVPFAVVNTLDMVMDDEQVLHNKSIGHFVHPKGGDIRYPNPPTIFSKSKTSIRFQAPELGQHTESILKELEYSKTEIDALFDEATVA